MWLEPTKKSVILRRMFLMGEPGLLCENVRLSNGGIIPVIHIQQNFNTKKFLKYCKEPIFVAD